MAGHSKWAQIKHKKAITDVKKGKVFSKLVREIMVASKVGGEARESNVRLRAAIERARIEGVPKDNIERAIIRGSGSAQGQTLKEFLYEATGPGGVAILIEGITDNTNRTIGEIKHLLVTRAGRIADPGSLMWNFKKIGVLEVDADQNPDTASDDRELLFIEAGVLDFFLRDRVWILETEFNDRERIRKQFEEKGVTVTLSRHDYRAANTIVLTSEDAAAAESLLDILSDHDDVQEVYTNISDDAQG